MQPMNWGAENTYYEGRDEADTDVDEDELTTLTHEDKVRIANENRYEGSTDVKSDHNLQGTERKYSLTVPQGKTLDDVYMRRDYNWLEYFATEVGKVETLITQAREKLGGVDVKPGNFTQANHVKTTTERLKTDYVANLDRIQNSLRHLVTRSHEVAKTYKTSDEMNTMKVDDLKGAFDQIAGELNKLKSVTVSDKPAT